MSLPISDFLPIELFDDNDEQVDVHSFRYRCSSCLSSLSPNELRGSHRIITLKKVEIQLDCTCVHCNKEVKTDLRVELKGSAYELTEFQSGLWKKIN